MTRRRQQLAFAQIADQVNAPGSWCPWVTPCVCPHCLPPHHSTGMGPGTVEGRLERSVVLSCGGLQSRAGRAMDGRGHRLTMAHPGRSAPTHAINEWLKEDQLMRTPPIVSPQEWQEAWERMLVKEK